MTLQRYEIVQDKQAPEEKELHIQLNAACGHIILCPSVDHSPYTSDNVIAENVHAQVAKSVPGLTEVKMRSEKHRLYRSG
ncbi:hypothetical protein D918_06532 [Trichuris suis]|nr:hypothetical protein D918_06532 [Trichuris suis]